MRKLLVIVAILFSYTANAQLPKGTVVDSTLHNVTRIGDSSWSYVKGWDYQFYILKSTKQYPFGIWVKAGPVIRNHCLCNPMYAKQKGFN